MPALLSHGGEFRNAMLAFYRSGWLLLVGMIAAAAVAIPLHAETPVPAAVPPPSADSPNDALATLAREAILKSLPPEYVKRENWGRQKESVVGFEWVNRDGGWHLDKRTKPLNDGLWRMYRVRLVDPQHNLNLQFTPPHPAENNRTALEIVLTARLRAEAWQEQWRLGIKGLNFYLEADATVEVRLDVEVGLQPSTEGSFGSIEVQPHVNSVGLRLVDLKVERIDKIGGDIAHELGRALKNVAADELHKREPEITAKINKEIAKHRDKLQFSPAQIATLGWDKIQALLGAR